MFTTRIVQHGTVFHEYAIVRDEQVVHTFRADPKEAAAIEQIFNLVETCAQREPHPFPFAIIHHPDQSAVLCGPKDESLNWGPVLTGPIGMLEALLPSLIESFNAIQTLANKHTSDNSHEKQHKPTHF